LIEYLERKISGANPMMKSTEGVIDYHVWLLSDLAYLGGVRLVQMARRHGLVLNHIPMRMQDVYAASGGMRSKRVGSRR
jgi:2-hydroxychromene-2-carboxylate isomerase